MYINRIAEESITAALKLFPCVCVIGPRQCGKTTIAKRFAEVYYDLEQQEDQTKLLLQLDSLLDGTSPIILDEAQEFPEIFKKLRGIIDSKRDINGRFIILCSVSHELMRHVSESLAGRLHIIELSPLTINEMDSSCVDNLWLMGGFPNGGIINKNQFPLWHKSYIDLLVKRDLPLLGLGAKPITTLRLLKMLAASTANLFNSSQLGNSIGVSHTTIRNYMEFLNGSFLTFQLHPYFANISKRLTKSTKIFFNDTGILHNLLDTTSPQKLFVQPWLGSSWENFVINQIISTFKQKDYSFSSYFFRTSDGKEIDLIIETEFLTSIEIKATPHVNINEIEYLKNTASLINSKKCALIYRGNEVIESQNLLILPIHKINLLEQFCTP